MFCVCVLCKAHWYFVRSYRTFLEDCEAGSIMHFKFSQQSKSMFIEQDKAGTYNTYVPFYADMRHHCKKINNPKEGLIFSVQMNNIPGYGILLQYCLPYLETGTDWNLTCMLFNLLSVAATSGKPLPEELIVLTDGGDGNWSAATSCFYSLLVKVGLFKRIVVYRCVQFCSFDPHTLVLSSHRKLLADCQSVTRTTRRMGTLASSPAGGTEAIAIAITIAIAIAIAIATAIAIAIAIAIANMHAV